MKIQVKIRTCVAKPHSILEFPTSIQSCQFPFGSYPQFYDFVTKFLKIDKTGVEDRLKIAFEADDEIAN